MLFTAKDRFQLFNTNETKLNIQQTNQNQNQNKKIEKNL